MLVRYGGVILHLHGTGRHFPSIGWYMGADKSLARPGRKQATPTEDFELHISYFSGFGGLGVACWPLVPKFAGSNPAEAVGFLRGEKVLSTPSFGGEVKPSVPCRRFAACKRSLNVAWKSTFRQNYRTILAHRVPPFATRGLSRCVDVGGGHMVAEAGTSKLGETQGCTISL